MRRRSLIAQVLTMLLVLSSFTTHGATSKKSSCNSGDKAYVYVVLLDISDPLTSPEKLAFEKLVDRILDEVPDGGRLDMYSIGPASKMLEKPELSVCKPESADKFGVSIGTKFSEKQREKKFFVPARGALLKHINGTQGTDTSPIVESIFNISLRSFLDGSSRNMKGKLLIISDFLQNSPLMSFHKLDAPSFSVWKNTSNGRLWVRNFPNVSAQAVVLPREKFFKFQNIRYRDFWLNYLKANFRCASWADLNKSISQGVNDGCN